VQNTESLGSDYASQPHSPCHANMKTLWGGWEQFGLPKSEEGLREKLFCLLYLRDRGAFVG
jgi:hypothetical protein